MRRELGSPSGQASDDLSVCPCCNNSATQDSWKCNLSKGVLVSFCRFPHLSPPDRLEEWMDGSSPLDLALKGGTRRRPGSMEAVVHHQEVGPTPDSLPAL